MLAIPKSPPEELIFKPAKKRLLLSMLMLWAFFVPLDTALFWILRSGDRAAAPEAAFAFWALLAVILLVLFYQIVSFMPKEGWIILDPKGFKVLSCLKSRRHEYHWEDVLYFFVTDEAASYMGREKVSFIAHIAGLDLQKDFAPYCYPASTFEIVQILNEWRERHIRPMEAIENTTTSEQVFTPKRLTRKSYKHPQTGEIYLDIPPMDKKVERITSFGSWGLAISAFVLFVLFFIIVATTETTTLKFYNFQSDIQPAFILTVRKQLSDDFVVYHLPPLPYRKKLEVRVPAFDGRYPIRFEYAINSHSECLNMRKHFDIWSQMDAIWVNPSGKIEAYAADYCKRTGRYTCRHMPNYIDISDCWTQGARKQSQSAAQNVHIEIKPLTSSDYKRLKEKRGLEF
jgi:hypothetical protein